jgi:hypothetical protein
LFDVAPVVLSAIPGVCGEILRRRADGEAKPRRRTEWCREHLTVYFAGPRGPVGAGISGVAGRVRSRTAGSVAAVRRLALAVCLLAVPAASACGGGDDTADARKAAETYVSRLGERNGGGTCGEMTATLQRQFVQAVVRRDARFRGRSCREIMQAALDTISADQLRRFSRAKIEAVKVDGDRGTFRYTLGNIRVEGRIAKEDGDWKVSCCVPGSG